MLEIDFDLHHKSSSVVVGMVGIGGDFPGFPPREENSMKNLGKRSAYPHTPQPDPAWPYTSLTRSLIPYLSTRFLKPVGLPSNSFSFIRVPNIFLLIEGILGIPGGPGKDSGGQQDPNRNDESHHLPAGGDH